VRVASEASAAVRAIEAVCRIESSRVIARIARLVRDVGLAEELAQDAFVVALEQWPESGVPDNPGAWLTAVAKRRAVDRIRRERNFASKKEAIGYETESSRPDIEPDLEEEPIEDDLLGAGGDHGTAHRAGRADLDRSQGPFRSPPRRGPGVAVGLGTGGRLPHLQ
jgi:DNA-directed RNA polymerase specialized sigma24 family protein